MKLSMSEKILAGCLLALSFFFLISAGLIVPSFWSVVFMVLSGIIFYTHLGGYKERLGKLYLVCEKVWGILFSMVALLFVHTVLLTRLGVPVWVILIAVVVITIIFTKSLWGKLRKKG